MRLACGQGQKPAQGLASKGAGLGEKGLRGTADPGAILIHPATSNLNPDCNSLLDCLRSSAWMHYDLPITHLSITASHGHTPPTTYYLLPTSTYL